MQKNSANFWHSDEQMCLLCGTTVRVVNRHGGSRQIDEQLFRQPWRSTNPVCGASACTARKNASSDSHPGWPAGTLPKATAESGGAEDSGRVSLTEQCLNLGFVITPGNKAEMHESDSSFAINQEC